MKKMILIACLLLANFVYATPLSDSLNNKKYAPAQLLADLDSLYHLLHNNHPDLYRFADRYEVALAWEETRKSITTPLTRWEFLKRISPLVNQFRDGHTHISYDFEDEAVQQLLERKGKIFPLRVSISGGQARVLEDWTGTFGNAEGKVLHAINGVPASQIVTELLSMTAGDHQDNINATLGRLFPYFLWAHFGFEQDFTITLLNKKGKPEHFRGQGLPVEEYFNRTFPRKDWQIRLYEKESLAVINCRAYRNSNDAKKFIDSAFALVRKKGLRHVALDLRSNGGGNSAIGDYFLSYITTEPYADVVSKTIRDGSLLNRFKQGSWISNMLLRYKEEGFRDGDCYTREFGVHAPDSVTFPQNRFNGKFYLLTGPSTYSSAHMTALAVKCFRLGVIIGEPTGERINLTGEAIGFDLPNTRLHGYCATAVYQSACGEASGMGVTPDISLSSLPTHIRQAKDPVLTYLLELVKIFN